MLKRLTLFFLILLFLLAASIAILLVSSPRIPLGDLSGPISSLLTRVTGENQQVSGQIFLTPGEWTKLELDGVTFNVRSGVTQIAGVVREAEVSIHLWTLLSGELRFDGILLADTSARVIQSETTDPGGTVLEKPRESGMSLDPLLPVETGPIRLRNVNVSFELPDGTLPQVVDIKHARGIFSRESPGELELDAAIDEIPFQTTIDTAPLNYLAADMDWDFSAVLSHRSTRGEITGSIGGSGDQPLLAGDVLISGESLNDISSLLGHQASENLPFSLRVELNLSPGQLEARISEFQPVSNNLDLVVTVQGSHVRTAQYSARLKGDRIDLDGLKTLVSPPGQAVGGSSANSRKTQISREDKLLPGELPIQNLKLSIDVSELIIAGNRIYEVRLDSDMINGRVEKAPFSARYKNSQSSGQCSFDFGGAVHEISAHYRITSLDIGSMLKALGLVDNLSMGFARAEANMHFKGTTIGEYLDSLSFSILAEEGSYLYRDPNTGADLPIKLQESRVALIPGEEFSLNLEGEINDVPVHFDLVLADQRTRNRADGSSLPIRIEIRAAGAAWSMNGKVPVPLGMDEGSLEFHLKGDLFSDLNDLLMLELPHVGPYQIGGTLARTPYGYNVDGLDVEVGTSVLHGNLRVDTRASPPVVDIRLTAPTIQLADFRELTDTGEQVDTGQSPGGVDNMFLEPEKHVLSDQEVLDKYDALIEVTVHEVLSGQDVLGSGFAKIEQKQGRLTISPLTLQLPGGAVAIDFSVGPAAEDRLYRLDVQVNEYDYGFIGRRFQPDTDMSGYIDLNTSLVSQSPDFKSIMKNATGALNVSIRPEKLSSGAIDFWAINFLSFLSSFLTSESTSKVNCFGGRFQIKDGQMTQEDLLIDTSRIQVRGDVQIDFIKRYINAYLRPIPKRPQFFSLATPIQISGSFSNVGVSVPPSGIIGTIARLATSYIVVPIQWIILNKLPEDGTAACLEMLEVEEEAVKE